MATAHRLRINGPDQYGYYRAGRCPCGWVGSPWERRADARREYNEHLKPGYVGAGFETKES
jgi:hypothetical protein